MARSAPLQDEDQAKRFSPLRTWTLCALPWLALVTGLSIYDHERAIGVMAQAEAAETVTGFALHWLVAAIAYTAEAIAFYGLLPAGITFVLFVLFLPRAIPWALGGDFED
jgi:putative exporter of polyketide antibiotics